jgi:hypothetical protein
MQIRQKMTIALISAVLVILCLLTSACVSAPVSTQVPPPVSLPVLTPATLTADNVSTIQVIPPPRVICNCPMEPAGSLTAAPTPTPDDGLCHCP